MVATDVAEQAIYLHDLARASGLTLALAQLLADEPAPGGAAGWTVRLAGTAGRPIELAFGRQSQPHHDASADFAVQICWIRLGASRGLADHCLEYLNGRRSGDGPMLRHSVLPVQLAGVALEHFELAGLLREASLDQPRWLPRWHAQLTDADRNLLRLLGASGYLAGGAGAATHRSEILADLYGACGPN